MYFFGGSYWLYVLLPGLVLGLWAQWRVRSAFKKYSRVRASGGLSGAEVARQMLLRASGQAAVKPGAEADLQAVRIEAIGGSLTDNYDPRDRVLRLSAPVFSGDSLAALGVAAHETGHALQHATGYGPLGLRSALLPMASLGSNLAMPLVFLGILFGGFGILLDLGIILYFAAVLFTLITLPVEFNASHRALVLLRDGGYIRPDEVSGAKAVLDAAAMTYVVAALVAILNLVWLLLLRNNRN